MSMNEMIKLGIRLSVVSRSCSFSLKVLLVIHGQIWFDFKSSFFKETFKFIYKIKFMLKVEIHMLII